MRPAEVQSIEPSRFPSLGDVLDFMAVIWGLQHALQRTSKRMETAVGVTGPQRLVIRIVGRFPGIPAGHLAELLHVHPSTLTGVLKRLEQRKLIRRRSDPRDGRRWLLGLTPRGRLFDVDAEGTVESAVERTLGRVSQQQLQSARKVLSAIVDALEKENSPPTDAGRGISSSVG